MLRFAVPLTILALALTPLVASAQDYRGTIERREFGGWELRNVGYDRPGTAESRREEWRQNWQRNGEYDRPGTVESRREWRQNWQRNGDYDRPGTDESRREWRRDAERNRYLRERYRDRYDRYDSWGNGRDRDFNGGVFIIPQFLF